MFLLPNFTLANLFEFVFHESAWNFLHIIYLCILKKCQNFHTFVWNEWQFRLFMEWGKIWITFGTFYDQLRALTLRGHKTFQLLLTSMLEWREVKNLAHNFWLCFCLLRYWTIFHFYFLWNWYWKLKILHNIKTAHFFKKSQAQFCSAITSSNIHPF